MIKRPIRSAADRPPRLGAVLTYAALGCWACVCLFPLYWAVAGSLKGPLDMVDGPFYAPFIDYRPALDAWAYILF